MANTITPAGTSPGGAGYDPSEEQVKSAYTLLATQAAAIAAGDESSAIVMSGASLVFWTVEVTTKGAITDLGMSWEAQTEQGQEWAPVLVEGLDTATGIATLVEYTVFDAIAAGLTAPFRRTYRVPAWAYSMRCTVWGTGAVGAAAVNVFALRR